MVTSGACGSAWPGRRSGARGRGPSGGLQPGSRQALDPSRSQEFWLLPGKAKPDAPCCPGQPHWRARSGSGAELTRGTPSHPVAPRSRVSEAPREGKVMGWVAGGASTAGSLPQARGLAHLGSPRRCKGPGTHILTHTWMHTRAQTQGQAGPGPTLSGLAHLMDTACWLAWDCAPTPGSHQEGGLGEGREEAGRVPWPSQVADRGLGGCCPPWPGPPPVLEGPAPDPSAWLPLLYSLCTLGIPKGPGGEWRCPGPWNTQVVLSPHACPPGTAPAAPGGSWA